jgi:hypothetical protein
MRITFSPARLGVLTCAALLAACGSSATSSSGAGGGTPPPGTTFALTETDNGRTLRALPGDRVDVVLTNTSRLPNGWSTPVSSDLTVLRADPVPAIACFSPCALGNFTALTPGTATVEASGPSGCAPGGPCVAAIRYRVTVIVVAPAS